MTPATRCMVATCVWSTRLLAFAVMVVAVGEVAQAALCMNEGRKG